MSEGSQDEVERRIVAQYEAEMAEWHHRRTMERYGLGTVLGLAGFTLGMLVFHLGRCWQTSSWFHGLSAGIHAVSLGWLLWTLWRPPAETRRHRPRCRPPPGLIRRTRHDGGGMAAGEPTTEERELVKQYLTIAETAARLSVSRRAIESRIFRGEFPHRKLGKRVLIPIKELEEFLAALPGATAEEALERVAHHHRLTR